MFKWGYFPESLKQIERQKSNDSISILWVGRLIKWKHPELLVSVATELLRQNIKFHINIIGIGPLENKLKQLMKKKVPSHYYTFIGAVKSDEVKKYMNQNDIYLFTSDYNEGWGVVLNEAMASGMAIVASYKAGSTPYLINHRDNGFIYTNKKQLIDYTKILISSSDLRMKFGKKASDTINELWNPKSAASNLIQLYNAIINKDKNLIPHKGPCSKAQIKSPWRILKDIKKLNKIGRSGGQIEK